MHEELHRFSVTERFQPKIPLKAFDSMIVGDKRNRQELITLLPKFQKLFAEKLRPNYLGDVGIAVGRLYFKSNLGKVTLSESDG